MLLYIVQSILLGGILVLIARQSRGFNGYQVLLALVWTAAVIVIKLKYGDDQVNFYSSDQLTQLEMYDRLLANGLFVTPRQFIADRYLILVPVRILDIFGIEPILATKFLQGVCLLLLYRVGVNFLERNNLKVRLFHAIFFAGPLFIFLSTLGLRDIEIALAATYFFLGPNFYLKQLSLLLLFPLRPHLAIALIFGWVAINYFKKFDFKRIYLVLIFLAIVSFALGGYSHVIGNRVQNDIALISPHIFDQNSWWRYLSNWVGLQFFLFDDRIVKFSITSLLSLRLIFIDSFLTPICFVVTLLSQKLKLSLLRVQVFLSFTFFLGLAAQTDFNSTRQNLPFLSTMGVLALLGVAKRDRDNGGKTIDKSLAHR